MGEAMPNRYLLRSQYSPLCKCRECRELRERFTEEELARRIPKWLKARLASEVSDSRKEPTVASRAGKVTVEYRPDRSAVADARRQERARIIGLIRERVENAGTAYGAAFDPYQRGRLDALSALLTELEGEQ